MMWGVGTLLAGGALTFGSLGLWFALLTFLLFITSFVPLYEERDMERRFGEEFRDYCRRVPRWWPRFRSG
jgi:protein-S-isoprenylcysteine O-methyltransferase Ste14